MNYTNGKRTVKTHKDVNKQTKAEITTKINALIKKVGFDEVRLVASNIFQDGMQKKKLEEAIKRKEQELEALKSKK